MLKLYNCDNYCSEHLEGEVIDVLICAESSMSHPHDDLSLLITPDSCPDRPRIQNTELHSCCEGDL